MWTIFRPDAHTVWRNKEVQRRLSWYRAVMLDEKPAKFRICDKIPAQADLTEASEQELWKEHHQLSERLRELHREVSSGQTKLEELRKPKTSFLDLKVALAERILTHCHFCERRCEVNRARGEIGFCGIADKPRVDTYFLHTGEEAPLVPSGTIFFSSCTFGHKGYSTSRPPLGPIPEKACVFCQNWSISTDATSGAELTPKKLALIMKHLRDKGARNINVVGGSPTPHTNSIIAALNHLCDLDVNAPLLWNSNMYCSLETMKLISDVMDIFLPDWKYGDNECAERLSGAKNYVEVVSRNHLIACENGDMIIRHLILPNHLECCTFKVLDALAKPPFKDRILLNLMGQYRPEHLVAYHRDRYPDIARRPTAQEMSKAYEYARELGVVFEPVS